MATDFNTKTIATSGSFKPSIANTPLDIRTIIYSLDDIENIPLPYIGMIFTLVDTTNNILTNYQVKTLKSKFINTIELPDALIDEYEQLNNIFSIKNLIIATNPQGNLKPLDNTGKTDIGENLQAMIDSLPLVNANNPLIRKGTIFLPEGKYALDIKNTITIPIGINIISSSGMKSGYANPIRDFGATIVLKNSNSLTNKNSIILKGKKLNGSASGLSGIRFTGDIGTTNNVVALDGMFNFIIDKCSFDYISCKNALIAISQCNGISLKDSSFTLIGDGGTNGKFTHGNAINFSSCGDSFIENCFIEACGGTGISLGTNCRISNCFVDLNKQGIICMGSENKIMGSTFKLNYYRGGYFSNNGGQSNNNIISDCSFINNCKVTTGISNICSLLLENNKNIKVIDTYFEKSDIVENDIILSGAVEGDIIDCTAPNGKDVIIGENKPIINNGVRIFNNKNLTIPTIDALPEANLRNYRKIVILSNSDSEKDKILFCIKEGSSYVWKDITQVTKEDIPTKTSQLVNDSNFLTEHQDLSAYAKKNELHTHSNKAILDNITQNKIDSWDNKSNFDGSYNNLTDTPTIPTKISQLTNDKNYLTSIPSEYITETELTAKGYLTEHQDLTEYATKTFVTNKITEASLSGSEVDLTGYATKDDLTSKADISDIPTKTSDLTNDIGYLTTIPSEYVTETELNAKGFITEHQNLSGYATTTALNNKVDKVKGKGLSTNDFTNTLKTKLEGLSNYDDTTLMSNISSCSIKLDEIKTLLNSSSGGGTTDLTEIETLVDECLALLN